MSLPPAADLHRLRQEYARRAQQPSDHYNPFNPAALYTLQQRQRSTLKLLRQLGYHNLAGQQILEMGCGSGGVLLEYLGYAADPQRLFGIDLLPQRLRQAHQLLPHLPVSCADGQQLPFADHSFDLELQYTAFSSLLDDRIKRHIASEMLRTLKPGGIILWYDFWLNPTNPHARGIRPPEIRQLFPGCQYNFHKITLAPPLARRLAPLSWPLALLLESLRLFNSHYLAAIRPSTPHQPP